MRQNPSAIKTSRIGRAFTCAASWKVLRSARELGLEPLHRERPRFFHSLEVGTFAAFLRTREAVACARERVRFKRTAGRLQCFLRGRHCRIHACVIFAVESENRSAHGTEPIDSGGSAVVDNDRT